MTSSPTSASSKRVAHYAAALHSFTSSPSTFRVLHSIPSNTSQKPSLPLAPPKHLYILDSSFNPPTLAHLRIAKTAIQEDGQTHPEAQTGTKRLLLLLATQNADKAAQPAAFEHRLCMMEGFAEELLEQLRRERDTKSGLVSGAGDAGEIQGVDIALTTEPYFVDKANAIAQHPDYPALVTTQIHLTGFDTLIRILNPKYYPPQHTLHTLQPFLSQHRLRVTYRTDSSPTPSNTPSYSSLASQDEYLRTIALGKREDEGALSSWVTDQRIELVAGRKEGEEAVSSTKVRGAVKNGDVDALGRLVSERVKDWILQEKLYLQD